MSPIMDDFQIVISSDWSDYELIDSGGGARLERVGKYFLIRPDAEAIWRRALPESEWQNASAIFQSSAEEMGGHWDKGSKLPLQWVINYKHLSFSVRLSASRHIGFFPEQGAQWDWLAHKITTANRSIRVLNLFGYTGLATLMAAAAGAKVTHVDASKKAIAWAKENAVLSRLQEKPIRWILDDALKFIQREVRRGSKYDALILDPPNLDVDPKVRSGNFTNCFQTCLSLAASY